MFISKLFIHYKQGDIKINLPRRSSAANLLFDSVSKSSTF